MRIEILLSGGGWYDTTIPSINAPDGLMMHYTRPFDIAILLVALPLMVFMALNEPLFWAGALVSTLLQVCASVMVVWIERPLVGWVGVGLPSIAIRLEMMASITFWPIQHHPDGLLRSHSKRHWLMNSWSTAGLRSPDSRNGL